MLPSQQATAFGDDGQLFWQSMSAKHTLVHAPESLDGVVAQAFTAPWAAWVQSAHEAQENVRPMAW